MLTQLRASRGPPFRYPHSRAPPGARPTQGIPGSLAAFPWRAVQPYPFPPPAGRTYRGTHAFFMYAGRGHLRQGQHS